MRDPTAQEVQELRTLLRTAIEGAIMAAGMPIMEHIEANYGKATMLRVAADLMDEYLTRQAGTDK